VSGKIQTAFVLGAGLGKRLRPLSDARPKPLIPVFGKPLITFALDHLCSIGVHSFVINTHHLAEQFDRFFASGSYGGLPVKLVHEPDLLETGGGIKNAEPFLGSGPFIVYSGDVLTDIEIETLVEEHFRAGNDVTLALRRTGLASAIAFESGRVVDINGRYGHGGTLDFANVSIWNAEIFGRIRAGEKVSFVPVLADWIGEGGKIGGVVLNERHWFNIGSRTEYLEVHRSILAQAWKPRYIADDWPVTVHPDARLASDVEMDGACAIGAGATVEAGARLKNTVVWDGAEIASGSRLERCIVRDHQRASGDAAGKDF
jgi:mannose-1-phosphate guanylyltransferase